jgi:hypothetical protein
MNEPMGRPSPDWYDHSENPGTWRFWDRQAWTEHRRQGPPGNPPLTPQPQPPRSSLARAAYLATMVVVGLFAAMMASVSSPGSPNYFPPTETEPEDPSTQPLEVVAAPDRCLLNVPETAPGTHEVVS